MEEGGETTETFFPSAGALESLGSGQADCEVKTILFSQLSSYTTSQCFAHLSDFVITPEGSSVTIQ